MFEIVLIFFIACGLIFHAWAINELQEKLKLQKNKILELEYNYSKLLKYFNK